MAETDRSGHEDFETGAAADNFNRLRVKETSGGTSAASPPGSLKTKLSGNAAPLPIAGELERIGGSRAQLDLVEFTLLKGYLSAGRLDDARRMLSARGRGSSRIPVAGSTAVH
jgi:hypothetical protein